MSASIQMQFGKAIRRLRLKAKFSQEKLAELAGLHVSYIGRIERGGQNVSLDNIRKLAHAFKVKPAVLFKSIR